MGYMWTTLGFLGFVCGVGVSLLFSGYAYWGIQYNHQEGQLRYWFVFCLPYTIFLVAWNFLYRWKKDRALFWMPALYAIGVSGGEYIGAKLFDHQHVSPHEKVLIGELIVGVQIVLCVLMFFVFWKKKSS